MTFLFQDVLMSYFTIDDYKVWIYNGFISYINLSEIGEIQRLNSGGYAYKRTRYSSYINEPGNLLIYYSNNYNYIIEPDQFYMKIGTKFGNFTHDNGLLSEHGAVSISSYRWILKPDCGYYNLQGEVHPPGCYEGVGVNGAPIGYYYNPNVWQPPKIIPGLHNYRNATHINIIDETPVLYDLNIPVIRNIKDPLDHCHSFEF